MDDCVAGSSARKPEAFEGPVRIGGFGGDESFAAYMQENEIDAVLDATHPFAAGAGRA